MSIYEMYFVSQDFKRIVDNFVVKHNINYLSAFKCMEVIDAYNSRLIHTMRKSAK